MLQGAPNLAERNASNTQSSMSRVDKAIRLLFSYQFPKNRTSPNLVLNDIEDVLKDGFGQSYYHPDVNKILNKINENNISNDDLQLEYTKLINVYKFGVKATPETAEIKRNPSKVKFAHALTACDLRLSPEIRKNHLKELAKLEIKQFGNYENGKKYIKLIYKSLGLKPQDRELKELMTLAQKELSKKNNAKRERALRFFKERVTAENIHDLNDPYLIAMREFNDEPIDEKNIPLTLLQALFALQKKPITNKVIKNLAAEYKQAVAKLFATNAPLRFNWLHLLYDPNYIQLLYKLAIEYQNNSRNNHQNALVSRFLYLCVINIDINKFPSAEQAAANEIQIRAKLQLAYMYKTDNSYGFHGDTNRCTNFYMEVALQPMSQNLESEIGRAKNDLATIHPIPFGGQSQKYEEIKQHWKKFNNRSDYDVDVLEHAKAYICFPDEAEPNDDGYQLAVKLLTLHLDLHKAEYRTLIARGDTNQYCNIHITIALLYFLGGKGLARDVARGMYHLEQCFNVNFQNEIAKEILNLIYLEKNLGFDELPIGVRLAHILAKRELKDVKLGEAGLHLIACLENARDSNRRLANIARARVLHCTFQKLAENYLTKAKPSAPPTIAEIVEFQKTRQNLVKELHKRDLAKDNIRLPTALEFLNDCVEKIHEKESLNLFLEDTPPIGTKFSAYETAIIDVLDNYEFALFRALKMQRDRLNSMIFENAFIRRDNEIERLRQLHMKDTRALQSEFEKAIRDLAGRHRADNAIPLSTIFDQRFKLYDKYTELLRLLLITQQRDLFDVLEAKLEAAKEKAKKHYRDKVKAILSTQTPNPKQKERVESDEEEELARPEGGINDDEDEEQGKGKGRPGKTDATKPLLKDKSKENYGTGKSSLEVVEISYAAIKAEQIAELEKLNENFPEAFLLEQAALLAEIKAMKLPPVINYYLCKHIKLMGEFKGTAELMPIEIYDILNNYESFSSHTARKRYWQANRHWYRAGVLYLGIFLAVVIPTGIGFTQYLLTDRPKFQYRKGPYNVSQVIEFITAVVGSIVGNWAGDSSTSHNMHFANEKQTENTLNVILTQLIVHAPLISLLTVAVITLCLRKLIEVLTHIPTELSVIPDEIKSDHVIYNGEKFVLPKKETQKEWPEPPTSVYSKTFESPESSDLDNERHPSQLQNQKLRQRAEIDPPQSRRTTATFEHAAIPQPEPGYVPVPAPGTMEIESIAHQGEIARMPGNRADNSALPGRVGVAIEGQHAHRVPMPEPSIAVISGDSNELTEMILSSARAETQAEVHQIVTSTGIQTSYEKIRSMMPTDEFTAARPAAEPASPARELPVQPANKLSNGGTSNGPELYQFFGVNRGKLERGSVAIRQAVRNPGQFQPVAPGIRRALVADAELFAPEAKPAAAAPVIPAAAAPVINAAPPSDADASAQNALLTPIIEPTAPPAPRPKSPSP